MFIPTKQQSEQIAQQFGTPVFITNAQTIRDRAQQMLNAFKGINMKIFYAIKSNYNPAIVKTIKEAGIYGIDAVSPNEVQLALNLGYTNEQIIFTPSNPSNKELQFVGNLGVLQNLGSLSELQRFGQMFPGQKVSVRLSPDVGEGEFDKITTGQYESKFGVTIEDFAEVKHICEEFDLKLVGVHSHIGSGFYNSEKFGMSVESVCKVAKDFPHLEFLDFGGGFGVQYNPEKAEIDLDHFAEAIEKPIAKFEEENGNKIEIRIEPGKFLVAQSTVLLTQATTRKTKGKDTFIGTDSGFHHLIRPAMYDAYHHIVNVSNPEGAKEFVQVAGNVCETCDVFNKGIEINEVREGDLLAILVAGGYGSSMSSNYNLREQAAEVIIDEDRIYLTKKRQNFEQIMENFI